MAKGKGNTQYSDEFIVEVANFVLTTELSVRGIARKFNTTNSTLKRWFNKEGRLDKIDPVLCQKVRDKLDELKEDRIERGITNYGSYIKHMQSFDLTEQIFDSFKKHSIKNKGILNLMETINEIVKELNSNNRLVRVHMARLVEMNRMEITKLYESMYCVKMKEK